MKFLLTLLSKILAIIAMISTLLSSLSGLGNKTEEDPLPENEIDISEFTIIYVGTDPLNVKTQTSALRKAISSSMGLDLDVKTDSSAEVAKEILIGKTNRAASSEALEKLKAETSEEAYIIDITETKIAIVGTTDNATARAVKIFKDEYVNISAEKDTLDVSYGKTKTEAYNSERIEVLENGLEIELMHESVTIVKEYGTTYIGDKELFVANIGYPKGITLQHQSDPKNNGKLIAHIFMSNRLVANSQACFVESSDKGLTWQVISQPTEQTPEGLADGLRPGNMSHIYELPEALGEYPAGTLVFASGSINYDVRSEIWMWYSTDCGRTWKQTTKLASGVHDKKQSWGYTGVWEPYSIYDNGYLYCFYSDDRDVDAVGLHDQTLVYRRTKDGVNWEEPQYVCRFDDHRDRPGMIIITKMGNGEYFMVYEYYGKNFNGDTNGQIYYKKTKDLSGWGDPSDPGTMIQSGKLQLIGAPACLWIPAGGECGTLIVSGKNDNSGGEEHRIMVSNDYGKTWVTMSNPLPYHLASNNKSGKSPALFADTDGRTVYYINQTVASGQTHRKIEFIAFKIY